MTTNNNKLNYGFMPVAIDTKQAENLQVLFWATDKLGIWLYMYFVTPRNRNT